MIEVTRTQLLPGVHLTAVQTQKFKSSVLGMQFLLPLAREQAALQALLPMVLRRGTAGFATWLVRAWRRLPCPPASSMATHSFFTSYHLSV